MAKREIVLHPLDVRLITVVSTELTAGCMRTLKFEGEDLAGFESQGPTDHVKVFFPDPATGVLTAPTMTPDGGIQRPDRAVSISRDYTPMQYTPATGDALPSLELVFVEHDNPGPATAWAMQAKAGDQVAIVGPRGSILVPTDVSEAVLIADETALPAFIRWLDLLPAEVKITAILQVEDESIESYLSQAQLSRANIEWLYRVDGKNQLLESVRAIQLSDNTYVWAAGEATELIPVRRYLKFDLGLTRDDFDVDGYWKRGIINLDHHAPLDETDPD